MESTKRVRKLVQAFAQTPFKLDLIFEFLQQEKKIQFSYGLWAAYLTDGFSFSFRRNILLAML